MLASLSDTQESERWPHDNRALLKGLCLKRWRKKRVFLLHRCSLLLYLSATETLSCSLSTSLHKPLSVKAPTCHLSLSSPSFPCPVSHLGSRRATGDRAPWVSFPASCREIDESELPVAAPVGSLRGPVWGTGSIEHQASRTNGHALEGKTERKEGRGEVCVYIGVW